MAWSSPSGWTYQPGLMKEYRAEIFDPKTGQRAQAVYQVSAVALEDERVPEIIKDRLHGYLEDFLGGPLNREWIEYTVSDVVIYSVDLAYAYGYEDLAAGHEVDIVTGEPL
jgi:hypothetical protein